MQDLIDNTNSIKHAIHSSNYVLAEKLALDTVKRYPIIEEAWILLGDSLLQQGYGLMAHKVYMRASLFNPQGTWLQDKLETLKKVPKGIIKQEIEELLQIRKNVTVGAAILVKNEERCIQRCLNSLVDAVDEIVVVDTGSTDNTVEIAKTFPKTKVVQFLWCDDFSAARNFGMSKVQSSWVFWVDADESLHSEDVGNIHYVASLLENYNPHPLLHVGQVNQIGHEVSVHYTPRLFPLRGHLKYYGKIHEQLGPLYGNRYTDFGTHDFFVRVRLLHDGYDPEKINIKKKLKRNIELLQQMTKEEPNDPTWWLYFGRELLAVGELDQAISALTLAKETATKTKGFGSILEVLKLLVICYLQKNNLEEAQQICVLMIEINQWFPDSYYYLACIQVENKEYNPLEVEANLKRAKSLYDTYRGLVSADSEIYKWKADLRLANLYLSSGNFEEATVILTQVKECCPKSYHESINQILNKLNSR